MRPAHDGIDTRHRHGPGAPDARPAHRNGRLLVHRIPVPARRRAAGKQRPLRQRGSAILIAQLALVLHRGALTMTSSFHYAAASSRTWSAAAHCEAADTHSHDALLDRVEALLSRGESRAAM